MNKKKKYILFISIVTSTLLAAAIIVVLVNPSIVFTVEKMILGDKQERPFNSVNEINRKKEEKVASTLISKFRAFPSFEYTIEEESDGAIPVITNPTSELLVVNKERSLPAGFKPPDLVEPNVRFSFSGEDEKRYLREEAARALEDLFAAAEEENIYLFAVSGYRSYERQVYLYHYYVETMGTEEAARASAFPGTSEHQTGWTMDISSQSNGFQLSQEFGDTVEGIWVANHAHEFGFIVRYEEDKEEITGYKYEPWHLRYVGINAANYLKENDLTLEEVFGKIF